MELKIVHPLTAQWLTEHGYSYKHEVRMPEYGQADFVAWKDTGEVIIVECKERLDRSAGRSMAQVLDYCRQYGRGAKPAIAAPRQYISDHVDQICDYYGALLIRLDDAGEIEFQYKYRNMKSRYEDGCGRYFQVFRFGGPYLEETTYDELERIYEGTIKLTYAFIDGVYPLMLEHGWTVEKARTILFQDIEEHLYWRSAEIENMFGEDISAPLPLLTIWRRRGVKTYLDYVELTNQILEVATGRKIAQTRLLQSTPEWTPDNSLTEIDYWTIQLTELIVGLLHDHRESFGKPELTEDIDDVRPVIDAARPEIHKLFSQKPRRLPGANKPKLPTGN